MVPSTTRDAAGVVPLGAVPLGGPISRSGRWLLEGTRLRREPHPRLGADAPRPKGPWNNNARPSHRQLDAFV